MRLQLLGLLVLVTMTTACGDDKNETATDSSTGGETSDATQGMSSTPTTGSEGSGGAEGSTADPGGTTTGAGSTSAGSTSDDPSGDAGLCDQLCAKAAECMVDLGPQCVLSCQDALSGEPACVAATDAVFSCLIGLGCPAFKAAIEDEVFGACEDAAADQEEACAGDVCESAIGINEDGTECSYMQSCPEGLFEMDCDTVTCTCAVDSMPAGECAAEGVCMAIEEVGVKAQSCCGFG